MKRTSISQPGHAAKHIAILPVLGLLLAATLWGIFWYPLRQLRDAGLGDLWSTFFIYTGTFVVIIPVFWRHHAEWRREVRWLLALMLTTGWCNLAFILAVLDGQVMRVLLLFYLSPLWATLLGWWWLKEEIHRDSLLVLIVAMLGAVVMLWDSQLGFPYPRDMADWLAISSGLAFALSNFVVRRVQNVSVWTKASNGWLGGWLLAAVALPFSQETLNMNLPVIFSAIGIGAGVMVIMTMSVMYGVTHMPLHRSSVILLFELVAGALSAYLLTDERMQLHEWTGGILVMIAAYFSARTIQEQ